MRKIGIVTIGQAPRPDVVPEMQRVLGDDVTILERGALDGHTIEMVRNLKAGPGESVLATRMRDGTEILVPHDHVVPEVQRCIAELENTGVELTLVLCTGGFPTFVSKKLVVYPSDILRGAVRGAIRRGRLAIVQPTVEQIAREERGKPVRKPAQWGEDVEVVYDAVSPYGPDADVEEMAERIRQAEVDLVFLNCMGFSSKHKEIVERKTGNPVIQSNTLVARVLKELID